MSSKTVQKLLVIAALAWALLPTWGGLLYAAAFVTLLMGTVSRVRAARGLVDAHREALAKGLSDDALAWVRRFPFFYVWPEGAKEWGTMWRMNGMLALFLAPWFAIRALFFKETWEYALLLPLFVSLVVGVRVALRLEVIDLLKEPRWRRFGPRHDEAQQYLSMRRTAGLWPPEPSRDGGGPPSQTLPPLPPGALGPPR